MPQRRGLRPLAQSAGFPVRLPWISAARHDDALRMLNAAIGERDCRIAELENERKLLSDKLFLMGIGCQVFNPVKIPTEDQAENTSKNEVIPEPPPRRPSDIVRRMERKAESEYAAKHDTRNPPPANVFDRVEAEIRHGR